MQNISAKSKNRVIDALLVLSAGLIVMTLASCAAEPPQPVVVPVGIPTSGAVNVMESSIADPAVSLPNCHFQGQVLVRTVDRVKPTNLAITPVEMVELKNKTMQLNANTAVVRQNHLVIDKGMFVHLIESDAYSCYANQY